MIDSNGKNVVQSMDAAYCTSQPHSMTEHPAEFNDCTIHDYYSRLFSVDLKTISFYLTVKAHLGNKDKTNARRSLSKT